MIKLAKVLMMIMIHIFWENSLVSFEEYESQKSFFDYLKIALRYIGINSKHLNLINVSWAILKIRISRKAY